MNYRDRRCPHCGRTNGLYTRYSYEGVVGYYDFNGKFVEEHLEGASLKGGKKMYCQVCNKYVCNVKDYEGKYLCQEESEAEGNTSS